MSKLHCSVLPEPSEGFSVPPDISEINEVINQPKTMHVSVDQKYESFHSVWSRAMLQGEQNTSVLPTTYKESEETVCDSYKSVGLVEVAENHFVCYILAAFQLHQISRHST